MMITVEMLVVRHPLRRSVRALLMHIAPTSGIWRQTAAPAMDEKRLCRKTFTQANHTCVQADLA